MQQQCEKLTDCPFFNHRLPNMPTMVEAIKRTYCLDTSTECARYQVSTAGKQVPADLFPNHRHRVAALLRS